MTKDEMVQDILTGYRTPVRDDVVLAIRGASGRSDLSTLLAYVGPGRNQTLCCHYYVAKPEEIVRLVQRVVEENPPAEHFLSSPHWHRQESCPTCMKCGGTGYYLNHGMCYRCIGKGFTTPADDTRNATYREYQGE